MVRLSVFRCKKETKKLCVWQTVNIFNFVVNRHKEELDKIDEFFAKENVAASDLQFKKTEKVSCAIENI